MSPEREQIVRDFIKRYDKWPKSTWSNQDYLRELIGEIDRLRSLVKDGLETIKVALDQRNNYQDQLDSLRIKYHHESAVRAILAKNLKTYGNHKYPCEVINWMYDTRWQAGAPKPACTCGYSKACGLCCGPGCRMCDNTGKCSPEKTGAKS